MVRPECEGKIYYVFETQKPITGKKKNKQHYVTSNSVSSTCHGVF